MDLESNLTNESLALSEALKELGISEEIVKLNRRCCMLLETIFEIQNNELKRYDSKHDTHYTFYIFGSRVEGTTTEGLQSDTDVLKCENNFNVIEDLENLKPDVINLLMVYDRTTPGYCMLQIRRGDLPQLKAAEIGDQDLSIDDKERILLKNSAARWELGRIREKRGAAFRRPRSRGNTANDTVNALPCALQLTQIGNWLKQTSGTWPTEDLKKRIANSRCFVVPVGSRGSTNNDLEWRISTSLAERELMFSLNVTQLQVYVLMKMLLKTWINHNVEKENHISSFMCKNVLLRCIQNTDNSDWQSHRLIPCLQYCLTELDKSTSLEHCPHFIITSNNLMYRRFTTYCKCQFAENFQHVFHHLSRGKIPISIDNIQSRFNVILQQRTDGVRYMENDASPGILISLASHVRSYILIERMSRALNALQKMCCSLQQLHRSGNDLQRTAATLMAPAVCGVIGSILASENIRKSNALSPEATIFLSVGFNSDVASYRLKLASALYRVDNLNRAESLLRNVKDMYDFETCSPVCTCGIDREMYTQTLRRKALISITDLIKISQLICYCVIFSPDERHSVPNELLYEMYRSTIKDLRHRSPKNDWMNWAVVDSLPYLYFLQYKVYGRLQRRDEQKTALDNLFLAIKKEPNLAHRETAWNLLGQCMEQEERWNDALDCYRRSLIERPRNNAAKVLIVSTTMV